MIITEHEDFARSVVALARQKGMTSINMTFCLSSTFNWQDRQDLPRDHYEQVSMQWTEGRHGSGNDIQLSARASCNIRETASA